MIRHLTLACFLMIFSFAEATGKEVPQTSKIKQLISGCGIKFWFMKDNSSPLVHIKIVFKNSGASYQEKSKSGVPQFYSHTVFCGCGKYSEVEFKKKCSDISVHISCQSGMDNMKFSMTAPKIVLNEAIELLNASLNSPVFEKDKVKKIQNGIGYSMQNYAANPIVSAFEILVPSIVFKSHAYENGAQGGSEDFMKLSIKDLEEYKTKFLVTANAEACVFGDISEKEAISLLDKVFSGTKKGYRAKDNVPDVNPKLISKISKYYTESSQSVLVFILKNEKPLSSRRAAAKILYRILGENCLFKSRIISELRTNQGLIYSALVVPIDLNHTSYIFGALQTDNSKVEQTTLALKKVIKKLKEEGITAEELEFAKNNIKGTLLVGLRTSGDLCQFYFGKMLNGSGVNALENDLEKIMNVELKDVNELAKELLDEDNMSLIIMGNDQ